MPIQGNNATTETTTKKTRKNEKRKRPELRLPIKLQKTILGKSVEYVRNLMKNYWELKLKPKRRKRRKKEQEFSESEEKYVDLTSLQAKKKVIETLEKLSQAIWLDQLYTRHLQVSDYITDFPIISLSSLQFSDNLIQYYRSSPDDISSPYKLRNNIIQLDLACCKPQDYNLKQIKFQMIINQP